VERAVSTAKKKAFQGYGLSRRISSPPSTHRFGQVPTRAANLIHCRIIAGLGKVGSGTERPTETEPITLSSPNPENLSHRQAVTVRGTGQASDLNHVLKLKVIDLPGETSDALSSHYAMVRV
jgi:hypothetical protein